MYNTLQRGLSSKNGLVRKGSTAALQIPKMFRALRTRPADLEQTPPVFANSVPKSGTHLLVQIVEGLPGRVNYGAFLSSMTSSFQFRERTPASVSRFIGHMQPGEIIRGHLFHDPQCAAELDRRNVVHCLVYRDPRDVVLSEAHYLRKMNRWHRLHEYFRNVDSIEAAIELSIRGLQPPVPGILYPNIGERYRRYVPWISHENCLAIRFEALRSKAVTEVVRQIAEFYASRSTVPADVDAWVAAMLAGIAPSRSHTFRSGSKAGWKQAFTRQHRELFHEFTGDLLVELGYEPDAEWVHQEYAPSTS